MSHSMLFARFSICPNPHIHNTRMSDIYPVYAIFNTENCLLVKLSFSAQLSNSLVRLRSNCLRSAHGVTCFLFVLMIAAQTLRWPSLLCAKESACSDSLSDAHQFQIFHGRSPNVFKHSTNGSAVLQFPSKESVGEVKATR